MKNIGVIFLVYTMLICESCDRQNPMHAGEETQGMGTVELKCIFPEENLAKITAPHAATTRAFLYIYSPRLIYHYGRQQLDIFNKNAKTQFQLLAGFERRFKVIGYDMVMNITYHGISGSVLVEQNKTVQVNIHMKKHGLVSIPGGSFDMGSNDLGDYEKPVHTVTVDGFLMSSTEVTREQWDMFISWFDIMRDDDLYYYGADYSRPMRNVTWPHALSFCNFISELAGLDPCYNEDTQECDFSKNGYRLPTEAEWEYACRAGTYTDYNTGEEESSLDSAGWYSGNSDSHEQPVGEKEPNQWGLYDMHGNVSEWCYDWFGRFYYESGQEDNPHGPDEPDISSVIPFPARVARGGNYRSDPETCLSAYRGYKEPNWGSNNEMKKTIGFRIVRNN
ncbi:formylglycine-generating enzyme family protein [Candidatus Omnitrophota bacterium]